MVKYNSSNFVLTALMVAITILFFPFLQQISVVTHHTPMYLLAVLCLCVLNTSFFKTKTFWYIIVYFCVVVLNYLTGDSYFKDFTLVWIEIIGLFIGLSFFDFCIRQEVNARYFLLAFCILLFIGTITSSYLAHLGLYSYDLAEGDESLDYMSRGMMDYVFPHIVPMLIPVFVYGAKDKCKTKIQRLTCCGLTACVLMIVYSCQAFTPLLMAIFSVICSLIINSSNQGNHHVRNLIVVSLIFIPLALSKDLQLFVLQTIGNLFDSSSHYASKISDLQASILYGNNQGGALEGRTDLYQMTFDSIISDFFIGTQTEHYSGHMALLDRFAVLGIVGILPLILLLVSNIKRTYKSLSMQVQPYYVIGVIACISVITTKNMIRSTTWMMLFIYLPMLLSYISRTEINKDIR